MKTDNGFSVTLDAPGYYSLAAVFERAFNQASEGKGKERHANDLPFHQQPMQTIARAHGVGFLTGQASKKAEECHGLAHDAKIAELLGAMNYLAGAVIFLEANRKPVAASLPPLDVEFPLGTEFLVGSPVAMPKPIGGPCAGCTTACHSYVFGTCEKQVRP